MASSRKNNALFLDQEALSALSILKAGMLSPVTELMNEAQMKEVLSTGRFNDTTFPFPFILAPAGSTNEKILASAKPDETLDLIVDGERSGTLVVGDVFEIDPNERVRHIYGTDNPSHPGVSSTLKRLGRLAVSGALSLENDPVAPILQNIEEAKQRIGAKHTTAIMMAANPLHRAHERLIRQTLDSTDLVVIFLLKPYNQADLSYEIREQALTYFVENYLPRNRVVIIPLEYSYIFAGYNEVIIDAIVAKNFGCDRLMIGQNHAGVGMYYDHNSNQSVKDRMHGIDIEVAIAREYVYCNECKTLVSTQTCPHGNHHHISYHADSILELVKTGLMPPAVLMRKEISAILLCRLFPGRIKNIEKLYYDIMPVNGLLEEHTDRDFYIKLMELYQTTSLT
ncbi:sulfate adenylyltransferase [Sulfurimonas sp. HSL-3221]|uniref:sulfate adenylyltransferase n=1 Tax=Sulfurimonadaceae TaxID=2771471 RepID=UPI001E6245DF|nr:sulfate adenylyltransferase [Sulfurimonas sp. HSL-3221]UFS61990.1 sulfate adenylyltransferase [Sulfurimonas sp. HSL-3221]